MLSLANRCSRVKEKDNFEQMKVAIVGGGVIGCAVAERLSRDGHRVTLYERDHLGAHASGAAAGLLAPYSELKGEDLGSRSARLFPDLSARLERDTGIAVEYRRTQSLAVAFDTAQRRSLRGLGHWQDTSECLALEPGLSPEVLGAVLLEESHINPPRFVLALARSAAAARADIREGSPVATLAGLRADRVVLAAGPWSSTLAEVPVVPRRGQLVALRPTRAVLTRIVTWGSFYLVPKLDGTIVVGSTEEEVGFDARPTAAGVSTLLDVAQLVVPALRTAILERVWAALRPATPDGRPIIGPLAGEERVVVATGHNRNGILLAPVTAELVANLLAKS